MFKLGLFCFTVQQRLASKKNLVHHVLMVATIGKVARGAFHLNLNVHQVSRKNFQWLRIEIIETARSA